MQLSGLIRACQAGLGLGPGSRPTLQRLGYPPEAKLLIVHADDLGLSHSVNAATFEALEAGAINSASVMVPCPALAEVAEYARRRPDADLGLHLTLTNEWSGCRWGPVAPAAQVSSLVGADGFFSKDAASVLRQARPVEVERELRAQVDRALEIGLRPTHLDCHMGVVFQGTELFGVLVKVARTYGLPFLAVQQAPSRRQRVMFALIPDHEILVDRLVMLDDTIPADRWLEAYGELVLDLQPGVTELVVHPGYDDPEMQAVTQGCSAWGAAWRQRDFDAVTSSAFQGLLRQHGIQLVTWRWLRERQAGVQAPAGA